MERETDRDRERQRDRDNEVEREWKNRNRTEMLQKSCVSHCVGTTWEGTPGKSVYQNFLCLECIIVIPMSSKLPQVLTVSPELST